jgi:hypothetical protein
MHRIKYYYGTIDINGEQRICRRKSWIVSNKSLPAGEEQDWTDTEIDPREFEDEFGNLRYIKSGAEPVLKEMTPSQEQKNKKKEDEYKQKLSAQIVDLIDECLSWEELKTKTEELKQSITAVMKKEKEYV